MKLSGELRNQVYENVFDFETVIIKSVIEHPRDIGTLRQNSTTENRTHYTLHFDGFWSEYDTHDESGHAELITTYSLAGTAPNDYRSLPVHVFLVSRQVFAEARSILYSKRFEQSGSFQSLHAFLQDTPGWAYAYIRKLTLECSVDNNENEENGKCLFSPKGSNAACKFVRERLNITELDLVLIVPGWKVGSQLSNDFQGFRWLKPLVGITGLERLDLLIFSHEAEEASMGDFIDVFGDYFGDVIENAASCLRTRMSSKMLKKGGILRYTYETNIRWPSGAGYSRTAFPVAS